MEQQFRQSQNLEQGLNLTPQLKRSLQILQKPALELRELISEEMRLNPLLEDAEEHEYSSGAEQKKTEGDFDDSQDEIYDAKAENDNSLSESDNAQIQKKRDFALNSLADKMSLEEYLLTEANLDAKNAQTAKAFAHLCGHLDDRGFLDCDALKSATEAGFDKESVDAALKLLRNSDPAGIGAFDMRDSLMLQLERNGEGASLAYRIIENRFELLLKRKVSEIAKLEGRSESDVENAIAQISKLHTSPAHEFTVSEEIYIAPDLEFFKGDDGQWSVRLVSDNLPKLRINPDYRRMGAQGTLRKEESAYIKEKIRDAKFIMDAVEQRQKTILKIGGVILQKQADFFVRGTEGLHPMKMQEVADILEIHATTVGRAISGKYAQTPFGIVALRNFFAGGYDSEEGGSVANSSVKEKIKTYISEESAQAPLSDSKIVQMLSEDGVNIARRTVAKYREELGIAPKNIRKRF